MLQQYTHGRDNNFNFLRLLAASLVVYGHSFPFVQGYSGRDPDWSGDLLFNLSGMDCGRFAVQLFFVMSGFLIAQSLSRRPSLGEFFTARALRLFPALTAAVLLCGFVVGPMFTTLPLGEYLRSDLLGRFLEMNLTLRNDPGQFLPGVFAANPYAHVINGSLWTLPWEVAMYASLALLAFTGVFAHRGLVALLTALAFAAFCTNRELHWIQVAYLPLFVGFFSFFYLGVLCWLYRDRVPMSPKALAVSAAVFVTCIVFFKASVLARCVLPLAMAHVVLSIALLPVRPLRAFNRTGDFSYGVYVYAFPVQQSLMALFPSLAPLQLCALGLAVSLMLAIPSWYLLEKPMLQLKPNGRRPRMAALPAPLLRSG